MPMKHLSVENLQTLEICAKVEDTNAELYHLFADQSSATPDIRKMWRQTAQEEEQHANQIRFGARLGEGAITHISIEKESATRMLNAVTALLTKAQAHPPAYRDALRVSIQLEEKLAGFHMDIFTSFCDEQCAKLFKSMMKSDQEHLKRLRVAYDLETVSTR